MPPHHPLTSFEMQSYYRNKPNSSIKKLLHLFITIKYKNLPEMKDRSYVINLDERKSIGTNWITSYVNGNNVTILTV